MKLIKLRCIVSFNMSYDIMKLHESEFQTPFFLKENICCFSTMLNSWFTCIHAEHFLAPASILAFWMSDLSNHTIFTWDLGSCSTPQMNDKCVCWQYNFCPVGVCLCMLLCWSRGRSQQINSFLSQTHHTTLKLCCQISSTPIQICTGALELARYAQTQTITTII